MENYFDFKKQIDDDKLRKIAHSLRNGKLAIFPTETVYGIGTNGLDSEAVKRIYETKARDFKNPINLLISGIDMVENVAQNITDLEYKLMEAFFPGPFTIILKKKPIVPDVVTANSDTVGIRMPNSEIAIKLVTYAGVPIAAPSANISGTLSGTSLQNMSNKFLNQVEYIIDGGKSNLGLESTIVRVIDGIPHILRPGSITPKQIEKIAGKVIIENSNLPSNNLKHYQLNAKAILVYSTDTIKMIDKLQKLSKNYKKAVILSYSENIKKYKAHYIDIIDMGSINNLELVSKELFANLKKAESLNPDMILIEGIKKDGLGLAIMNRLLNVCDNNYIEI